MTRQDSPAVSVALAAAQELLHRRRQQRRQERISQQLPIHTDSHGRSRLPLPSSDQKKRTVCQPRWHSQPLHRHLQQRLAQHAAQAQRTHALSLSWLPSQALCANNETTCKQPQSHLRPKKDTTTVYPDLALAMLKHNFAAPGRLWLLFRYLDTAGKGWIGVEEARHQLTEPHSDTHLCGWRQLRNLLVKGQDIFWVRQNDGAFSDRIWLRSPAKVALALKISKLKLKPVSIPVDILLDTIGAVRAHFFASFHSGREEARPISRQSLKDITGVSRRSQRTYEKRARVRTERNWAIGEQYTKLAHEQRAWRHGHAAFRMTDNKGKVGPPGNTYVAWQLPNSYSGPHALQSNRAKKRINRQLTDLLEKGITGNGKREVEKPAPDQDQDTGSTLRYHEHGRAAARSYNRNARNDLYWRCSARHHKCQLWYLLPGQEGKTS